MGIRFCSLSSGSSGNCQYIETDNTRILIDAGFSGKRIEALLSSIGVCPTTLDGIFVTHEHIDHTRGVGILSRRYDLPIFANNNTWIGMNKSIGNVKEVNTKVFITEKDLQLQDLNIHPFHIFHDALEPVGYTISFNNKKISIITDTGWVDSNIVDKIKKSDLYLIESNHDVQMLREGSYPWYLKERVMSDKGHLSNDDTAKVLSQILLGNNEVVLLGHLSQENNIPELAIDTVKRSISKDGLDADKDIRLGLSFRDKTTQVYNL